MNRRLGMAVFGVAMVSAMAAADEPADAYFGDRQLSPDELEQRALDALGSNRPTGPSGEPVLTGDKSIQFVYGESLPTVICAPFRVCDIALQPGEQVRGSPVLGDSRWKVTPGISGEGEHEVWHIYVKPLDVGLKTSLTITTNRRDYHFQLASDRARYMARVSFTYPEDHQKHWAAFRLRHERRTAADRREPPPAPRSAASRQSSIAALSFAYEMEGDDPPWKPERVYNDGTHTIIEFPAQITQTQMPALVAIRYEGGLFTDDESQSVNYRIHGRKIKVDGVPDIMDLISGVGSTQIKVRIRRTAEEP